MTASGTRSFASQTERQHRQNSGDGSGTEESHESLILRLAVRREEFWLFSTRIMGAR
jgi:hypothetical protein